MLIMLSRRTAICQSDAEVYLRAVSHRFNFIIIIIIIIIIIQIHFVIRLASR